MYRYIEGHGVISNSYTVKCYLLKIKFTIQYNTIHRCILSAHARESFRAIANGGL